MRIALLTEIPAPFRLPLFAALAAEPDVDLRVFFLAANDPRRNYPSYPLDFPAEVLPGKDAMARGRWLVVNVGVLGRLRRFRPDLVLVGGWNQPAFWQALLHARTARVPLVVWVESTARDERAGRGPPRRRSARSSARQQRSSSPVGRLRSTSAGSARRRSRSRRTRSTSASSASGRSGVPRSARSSASTA